MDVNSLLKVMVRRWVFVLPVLVVTAAIAATLVGSSVTRYSTTGSELLVTATESESGSAGFAFSPSIAGPIVTAALNGGLGRQLLAERGLESSSSVGLDATSTVLTAVVTGDDPSDVLETGQALLEGAPDVLAEVVGEQSASGVRLLALGAPLPTDIVTVDGQSQLEVSLVVVPAQESEFNPFAPNPSTVRTIIDLARRPDVADAVRSAAGTDVDYEVDAAPALSSGLRDSAPILSVLVASPDQGELLRAYDALIAALGEQLASLQQDAGVPQNNRTVITSLVPPTDAQVSSSSVVRSAAAVVLLGLGVAAAFAVAVDASEIRRRRRAGAATEPGPIIQP
jgi:hypothetical protein